MSDTTTIARVTTRSGLGLSIRPVASDDGPLLKQFFDQVSQEDLRFRFLSAMHRISDEQIANMLAVDHKLTEDFLAFTDDGTLVGSAIVASDAAGERAEVAIAVRADFKNRGIGWALLDHAADYAKGRGVKTLEAVESRANRQAIAVERDFGFTVKSFPGDAALVIVSKQL